MSTAPRYIPHYTVDDYAHWEGDWELIDGVPIAMSPSPFGPHERVVSRLARAIGNEIEQNRCDCEVYTNLDWIVSRDTVVRPDVMVVCGEQPARHLERPPALAVEVLSDSTRAQDLTAKRDLYREHRVPHYLIVDPDRRNVQWMAIGETDAVDIDETSEIQLTVDERCSIQIGFQRLFE